MSRTHHHGEWKPWVKRPAGAYFTNMTPSWWTRLNMNRPKRHRDTEMLRRVAAGADPDSAIWGLGNHKPHLYFW